MRYAQIKAFHHVALHGGFSRAAEALGLSQPALSEQVRQLELHYDLLLFRRQNRRVELTDRGRDLFKLTSRFFENESAIASFLDEPAQGFAAVCGSWWIRQRMPPLHCVNFERTTRTYVCT